VAALRGLRSPESVANKRSMQVDELDYQRRGGNPTAIRRSSSPPGTQGQPQRAAAAPKAAGQPEGGTP
jgi:small subunit ribosomal protein S5